MAGDDDVPWWDSHQKERWQSWKDERAKKESSIGEEGGKEGGGNYCTVSFPS